MTLPPFSVIESIGLLWLFIVWATLLFGGFARGPLNAEQTHRIPRFNRMSASATLVLAAWVGVLVTLNTAWGTYALLIAIGMSLGFIGDLFMAELIPVLPDGQHVLGGIGAFGLGHIAYIGGIIHLSNQTGLTADSRWLVLALWLIAAVILWYLVVYRNSEKTMMHMAALPYALLLATTTGLASGLAIQSGQFIPLAIGAALFLISDLLLAAQLFNNLHFIGIGDAVWFLYSPGQMLIVYTLPIIALIT